MDDDALSGTMRRVALLCLVPLAACAEPPPPPATVEILDSAGVRVVLNPPPGAAPLWPVAEEPSLEIGGLEADPSHALFQVRGAVRLADSMVVVANAGSLELRWFDPRGLHLRSAGGRGDGPTELRDLTLVGVLPGDSIVVSDLRRRRMLVYDRTGRIGRVHTLSSDFGAFPAPVGVLDDGSVLLMPQRASEVVPAGLQRHPLAVVVAGPDGLERRRFGEFPGIEGLCTPSARGDGSCNPYVPVLFGRRLLWSGAGDRIALATSDSFSVRLYDGGGSLVQVVRQRHLPSDVEEGDFEREWDIQMEPFSSRAQANFATLLDDMPRHTTYPAFASLRVDRDGALWVEASRRPGDDRAVWQIFDREGVLIGRVEAPPDLAITDSGPDYVLGVAEDDDDVERVRLYRLDRPAARRSPPP